MTTRIDLARPERVLAVGAHPDDIEFGCGATLAKWADAGAEVYLCVCTDGSKGSWDPLVEPGELVQRRETEQRDAAGVLGAKDVHFLRFVDGELAAGPAERATLVGVLRSVRPDVVLGHDPWSSYRSHPDHHHAGRLVVEGIVAGRDPHFFAEQGPPHRPATLLLFESGAVNHVEAVTGYVDRKADALLCHRSQWRSTMGIDKDPDAERARFVQGLRDRAQAAGIHAGLRSGEAFTRLDNL